jgi:hypothetical protein
VADVAAVRNALLELHRELLQAQRVLTERCAGRMSASELLQAATEDLRFAWLQELSTLLGELDQAISGEDTDAAEAAVGRTRELLSPPDPGTAFGTRYLRALQDHPEVVMAHGALMSALAE